MPSRTITNENHSAGLNTSADSAIVRGKFYNELKAETDAHAIAFAAHEVVNKRETISEAASTTLVAADSGKTFFVDAATAAATYTLPTPVAGLKFKFIWVANCDNAVIIQTADTTDTTGDMLRGGLLVCAAAAVNTFVEAASDVNTLTIDDNVVNAGGGIGSWVEIICAEDAVWYVTGVINSTTDADGTGSALFTDAD
jgi:hypothetical protein